MPRVSLGKVSDTNSRGVNVINISSMQVGRPAPGGAAPGPPRRGFLLAL